jgi:hypothetical protein
MLVRAYLDAAVVEEFELDLVDRLGIRRDHVNIFRADSPQRLVDRGRRYHRRHVGSSANPLGNLPIPSQPFIETAAGACEDDQFRIDLRDRADRRFRLATYLIERRRSARRRIAVIQANGME